MNQIKLSSFQKKEIKNISGKGISFKKIKIPNENCSNFYIKYEIVNPINQSEYSSLIHCIPSIYQRDVSQVVLHESIIVPDNCVFNIKMESVQKVGFVGDTYIDYEIFETTEQKKLSGIKVFISENDRQYAFSIALKNLARFFKLKNWEHFNNGELYSEIINIQNPIVELLKQYFEAYDAWFNFYAGIKNKENVTSQPQILTYEKKQDLETLIKKREDTLKTLQKEFDKQQLEKFQKEHGLEDIDGTLS